MKLRSLFIVRLVLGVIFVGTTAVFAAKPDNSVYMMPMNCGELLPDTTNFVGYFESVAKGLAGSDKSFSKRMLKVLSLREKVAEVVDLNRAPNPVDTLIQKTVCFYREQKEPLKPITFDDPNFITFLKTSFKDLEGKVEDAVFNAQFEKYQREEYDRRVQANRGAIETLEKEAARDASRAFDKISSNAKRKARVE